MAVKIHLSKRGTKYKGMYEATVDDCDADLADLHWSCRVEKHTVYAMWQKTLLHKIILERIVKRELLLSEYPDHIDGDGLNNCRANLRIVTSSQNSMNRRVNTNSKTGYKGVSKKSSGRYRARITVNKKHIYLGVFDTAEQAHKAYCEASIQHFGDFANTGE